jgi:peptidoglycan/xylan/chitin deacetylase (PgdA/CDA1 family)
VTATFFNLGQNAAARPQLVSGEARMGYLLGNHTWDHLNMSALSASAQATEMDRATAEQKALAGAPPCAFRPPGGAYNSTTLSLAQQRRMKFWMWSVDTEDWKANGSSSSYWVNRIITLAERQGEALQHPVVLITISLRVIPLPCSPCPRSSASSAATVTPSSTCWATPGSAT